MSVTDVVEIHTLATRVPLELLRVLASLSQRRQAEILDFALFLKQRAAQEVYSAETASPTKIRLRPVPADSMLRLTGLVALGGDALVDSEALYAGEVEP